MGLMADRLNLRWVFAGAFALWSLAQGLTGFAGSLAVLIGFRMLLGVGESVYLPGGTKIVSLLFAPFERGLPSGVFDFGTRTGLFAEGLIIPWILNHYGWRNMFCIVGFVALVWLLPWLMVFPPKLSRPPQAPSQDKAREAVALLKRRLVTFDRNLLGICLGFFCFDYYWYLLVTWLPDYLVNVRHFTLMQAGIFAALPFLVFGLGEPIGGWIGDRLIHRGWNETRTRKGIVTIAFLTGLLLIPATRVANAHTAIAFLLGACLVGLATGNLLTILQCCAPPEEVGVWTGFENFSGNIAGILAPLLTGFLIARTGSYSSGFILAALVLVAGLFSYWLIVGRLDSTAIRQA